MACACEGGLFQCRWGFGHAPGMAVFIKVHNKEPSVHKSAIPPDNVLVCEDHVPGSRFVAHLSNFSLLLSDGQNTESYIAYINKLYNSPLKALL